MDPQLIFASIDDRNTRDPYIFGNLCAVSTRDFRPSPDGADLYLQLTRADGRKFVVNSRPLPGFPGGRFYLSDALRKSFDVAKSDIFTGRIFNPFESGESCYVATLDVSVSFASKNKISDGTYNSDDLEERFKNQFRSQILAPGMTLLLDVRNVPISMYIQTIELGNLSSQPHATSSSSPEARGILVPQTRVNFTKDAKSPIKLKGSSSRPVANAIIAPDFNFQSLGIGGLESEFTEIFRGAFASRIFPPAVIERMNISHCKGILLHGPPGTGKTLIARKIGKLLNATEPIVVNGPELLNKFVGASEENVRKLFAAAEKEYKEKGDESSLHIIIFDELDAVCKQRGSTGGGTGVGDNIVNQLLTKLDGVDQLNNFLLIGMTNRKDLIDEALMRPGRLELHIEISLPDEAGRRDILAIHTASMRESKYLARDVDLNELAAKAKNYSGAEIAGLVRSAASFAFTRHSKLDQMARFENIENIQVCRDDFLAALSRIKPAYGVSEDDLAAAMPDGLIRFNRSVELAIKQAMDRVLLVRNGDRSVMSVCLYGPVRSGKTALAAHIAQLADFPFIKMIRPKQLMDLPTEIQKNEHIGKVFADAYKSPLSMVIIDSVENLIQYNQVGPRFSVTILESLLTNANNPPPKGHRVFVIFTTSRWTVLDQLGASEHVGMPIAVPTVNTVGDLETVLRELDVIRSPEEVYSIRQQLGDLRVTNNMGLGIKDAVDMAIQARTEERMADELVRLVTGQMARNGVMTGH